jgi:two-component system sensor histidine kinase UhpB
MALGHVPLRQILSELVQERARQLPQVDFAFSADKLLPSYGDSVDLTVYRCMQESLTNVVRHARANHVSVELREADGNAPGEHANGSPRLRLTVRDDGCGIDPAMPPGFGLRGMQERVQGLGGSYKVESARGRGTCVLIAIPIAAPRPEHP